MQLVSSSVQHLRSAKGPVWTITTVRTRLQWGGTASRLQITKTDPLTQLFLASINTHQLPHIGTCHSPYLKARKAKGKTSGQHLTITKMEKLAGIWRKEKLGDLVQAYRKHFPKNLFPKIVAFYTFQATCSLLTINSFPLLILFDFHWEI